MAAYKEFEKSFGKGTSYKIPPIEELAAYQEGYSEGNKIDYSKSTIDETIFEEIVWTLCKFQVKQGGFFMGNEKTDNKIIHFERWVDEPEAELFEIENFKRIGKEDDYIFQVLAFMGEASQQMALAFTLTNSIENFPGELTKEFRDIATKYHDLQYKVRDLK